MTEEVCQYIADKLKALPYDYLDRIEGSATRARFKDKEGVKYYPFTHDASDCTKGHAITPDEKRNTVLWMEAGDVRPVEVRGRQIKGLFVMSFRLLGWVNLKKLEEDRDFTGEIESTLIHEIEKISGSNTADLKIDKVQWVRTPEKSVSLFNRYSFREDMQWWFGDYDYFAQDYEVRFTYGCNLVDPTMLFTDINDDETQTPVVTEVDLPNTEIIEINVVGGKATVITPECSGDPVTIENSDQSYQETAQPGDTHVVPDTDVTQVDGSQSQVPATTPVVCEWNELTVENTEGLLKKTVSVYPTGEVIEIDDVTVVGEGDFPMPANISVAGRPITSVTYIAFNDTLGIVVEGCPVVFPIDIVNSLGATLDTISSDPSGSFEIGTVNVIDADGTEAVQRPSDLIRVEDSNGLVSATLEASDNGETLKIIVPDAASPSGIAYCPPNAPASQEISLKEGDCADRFQKGEYVYTPPAYPVYLAQIDYNATQADVRATAATGTNLTDGVAGTILENNNAFGNKFRYTDDAGNPSDASVGSNIWAHVDWLNHSFTGATDGYVIDHHTGQGMNINHLVIGGNNNLHAPDGAGQSWEDWIQDIFLLGTYLGYTGWRPLDLNSAALGAHWAKCEPVTNWADNFFNASRSDNRCGMMLGETNGGVGYLSLVDSNDGDMVWEESTISGFQNRITNVFLIRQHYT